MVGQNERFGLPVSASSATSSSRGLIRSPAGRGSSPGVLAVVGLNSLDITPPRLSIMWGKQDTSRQTTACPTLAAVRPDFETFAETRGSRLH